MIQQYTGMEACCNSLLRRTQQQYEQDHLIRVLDPVKVDTKTAVFYQLGKQIPKFRSLLQAHRWLKRCGKLHQLYEQLVVNQLAFRPETNHKIYFISETLVFYKSVHPNGFQYRVAEFVVEKLSSFKNCAVLLKAMPNCEAKTRFELRAAHSAQDTIRNYIDPTNQYTIAKTQTQLLQVVAFAAKEMLKRVYQAKEFCNDFQGMEACSAVKRQMETLLKKEKTL